MHAYSIENSQGKSHAMTILTNISFGEFWSATNVGSIRDFKNIYFPILFLKIVDNDVYDTANDWGVTSWRNTAYLRTLNSKLPKSICSTQR